MKTLILLAILVIAIAVMGCGQTTSYSTIDNSCRVATTALGTVLTCPSSSTQVLIDTKNVTISAQPFCPNKPASNGFQESYFINTDGTLWAILDTGSAMGVYLTYIKPGMYSTSDGSGCNFRVNADNTITVLN